MALGVVETNKVLYEVDFSSLASQNLATGGDGSKTIDGKTWYLWNSSGVTVDITNGTGLRVAGAGASGNNQNSVFLGMPIRPLGGRSNSIEFWTEISYTGTLSSWPSFSYRGWFLGGVPLQDPTANTDLPSEPLPAFEQSTNSLHTVHAIVTNSATVIKSDTTARAVNPQINVLVSNNNMNSMFYGSPTTPPEWPKLENLTQSWAAKLDVGTSRIYTTNQYGIGFVGHQGTDLLVVKRMRIVCV